MVNLYVKQSQVMKNFKTADCSRGRLKSESGEMEKILLYRYWKGPSCVLAAWCRALYTTEPHLVQYMLIDFELKISLTTSIYWPEKIYNHKPHGFPSIIWQQSGLSGWNRSDWTMKALTFVSQLHILTEPSAKQWKRVKELRAWQSQQASLTAIWTERKWLFDAYLGIWGV